MIGVLIPAYNAEATIRKVALGALRHSKAVLVVDDGSVDQTAQRASEAGAAVKRHAANRGKGAALRTGFTWMMEHEAAAVITMDADMQHDADDLPRFVERFEKGGADLIIGSRRADFVGMTRGRRFGNRFSCEALKLFAGLELPDSQSGYRLYGAGFLKQLKLHRHAYDAEIEALMVAALRRCRIETIPITSRAADGRPTSYFRPWVDTARICRTVVLYSACNY